MKKSAILVLAFFFILAFSAEEILARGARGGVGGFHAVGGVSHGGYQGGAAFRSPSMSRTFSNVPSVSHQSSRPVNRAVSPRPPGPASRPTQGQVKDFLNLPQGKGSGFGSDALKVGTGVAVGVLGAEGAKRLLDGQKAGGADRRGLADRPGGPGRAPQPAERPGRDQIRADLQDRTRHAFTPEWWKNHPNAAKAYWEHHDNHHHPWHYWWRPATWAALVGFTAGVTAGSAYGEPVYYNYGDNIYYDGGDVYFGGNKVGTKEEYYQQAGDLAGAAQIATDQQSEDWLPLGVFALGQNNVGNANMVLQLAVNKEGVIRGTYYNTSTDTARPVKGMVDRKTQRAAWMFADGKNTDIIMETGIYNLTQDETEALVHFGKDNTQRWLMVRLEQPQEAEPPAKKPQSS